MPAGSTDAGRRGSRDRADARRRGRPLDRARRADAHARQRLADLRAQRAANLLGAAADRSSCRAARAEPLRDGMAAVLDYAERRTRDAIAALADGTYEATDRLEAA